MTPEIKKKRKHLEGWHQSEIFRQIQNMKIYFVMLIGPQIIKFWMLCPVNFFFSFKAHRNIRKLKVLLSLLCVNFGLWCEFFCRKTCLGSSIKSVWVWLLFTITWLHIYQDVTAIEFEAQLESLEIYFYEKKDSTLADVIEKISCLNLASFTFCKSQLCWKFHLCCRRQTPLVNDLHQLFVELKIGFLAGFERQWYRERLNHYMLRFIYKEITDKSSFVDVAVNEFCFGSAERSHLFGHFC